MRLLMVRGVSVLLGAVLAAFAVMGVIPGTSAPAAALCITSIDAKCNPQVLGVFAAFGEAAPGAAGAVASTGTATTGTTAVVSSAPGTATAVFAFLGGLGAGHFIWGEDPPPELTMTEGVPAGWVGGSHTITGGDSPNQTTLRFDVLADTWTYGAGGSVTVRYTIAAKTGAGYFPNNTERLSCFNSDGSPYDCTTSGDTTFFWKNWASTSVGATKTVTFIMTGTAHTLKSTSISAEYRPEGYPGGRPPGEAAGVGTVTTTIQCINSEGGLSTFTSTQTVTYAAAVAFDTPAMDCPEGRVLYGYGITWTPDEGPAEDIVPWTVTPDWVHNVPVEFPGCLPGTACELRLFKTGDGPLEYCGVAAVGCPDWYHDPANTENYECRWGPYVVDLGQCNVFRNPGRTTPNIGTETDPHNGVQHSPGLDPNVSLSLPPSTYDYTPGAPDPTLPDWSTPAGPAGQSGECFPTGWGVLNPAEWVLKPVKCALVWAFVPRQSVVELEFARAQEALEGNGVLAVVPAAAEVPATLTDGWSGGCSGGIFAVEVPMGVGTLEASLPCSPGSVFPSVATQYANAYTLWSLLLVAGTAWAGFMIVRSYVGGRD